MYKLKKEEEEDREEEEEEEILKNRSILYANIKKDK